MGKAHLLFLYDAVGATQERSGALHFGGLCAPGITGRMPGQDAPG